MESGKRKQSQQMIWQASRLLVWAKGRPDICRHLTALPEAVSASRTSPRWRCLSALPLGNSGLPPGDDGGSDSLLRSVSGLGSNASKSGQESRSSLEMHSNSTLLPLQDKPIRQGADALRPRISTCFRRRAQTTAIESRS